MAENLLLDTASVKGAVKDLILSHADILTDGFVQQGAQRVLRHVSTSALSPAREFHFVYITCPDSFLRKAKDTARTTVRGTPEAVYEVRLELYDEAVISPDDDESYEVVQAEFDRMVDRIVALIDRQTWLSISPRTRLSLDEGREISRRDLSGSWVDDDEAVTPWLYAQINFMLSGKCSG